MQEYRAINDRDMNKTTRAVALVFSVGMVVLSVFIHSLYTGIVGAVIFAATILKKYTLANQDGILTVYDMFFFDHRELWKYEDIIEIHVEDSPNKGQVGLHFTKESLMAKRVVFSRGVADDVIALALAKNDKIQVDSE